MQVCMRYSVVCQMFLQKSLQNTNSVPFPTNSVNALMANICITNFKTDNMI